MALSMKTEIDLFGKELPSKEQLYELFGIVNSSEINKIEFAKDVETAEQKKNNIAAGIGYAILGNNKSAIENLEKAKDCVEKHLYMAWAFRKLGKFDQALDCLKKAAKKSKLYS